MVLRRRKCQRKGKVSCLFHVSWHHCSSFTLIFRPFSRLLLLAKVAEKGCRRMAEFLTMQLNTICPSSHNPCEWQQTLTIVPLCRAPLTETNCSLLQMQITHNLTKIGCGSDYTVSWDLKWSVVWHRVALLLLCAISPSQTWHSDCYQFIL